MLGTCKVMRSLDENQCFGGGWSNDTTSLGDTKMIHYDPQVRELEAAKASSTR